eukprot:450137_1
MNKLQLLLLRDRRISRVRTGNGYIDVRTYLPMHIRYKNKVIHTKFYVINALPYNYLIGRSLVRCLGYELIRRNETFHHKAVPELYDAELDDPTCSLYPLSTDNFDVNSEDIHISEKRAEPEIKKLLYDYQETLAKHRTDIGDMPIEPVKIELIDPHQQQDLDTAGKVELSDSGWKSSAFPRPKKTGDVRLVFDFRPLNAVIKSDKFPLPNIYELLHKFRKKKYMSLLDMRSGFWQKLTAFEWNHRLYHWNFMPMGLKNAPAVFQRVMTKIFKDLDFVVVYIDDIAILSESLDEHMIHLAELHDLAKPLYELLETNVPFDMNPVRKAAFNEIKSRIQAANYLIHPDPDGKFHVFCDASINGIGGVIGQYDTAQIFRPIV